MFGDKFFSPKYFARRFFGRLMSPVTPPDPPYVYGGSGIADYRDQELLARRRLIQNNNNAIILFLTS